MFLKTAISTVKVQEKRTILAGLMRLFSSLKSQNFEPRLCSPTIKFTHNYFSHRNIQHSHHLQAKTYVERENNYLYDCINHSLLLRFPKNSTTDSTTDITTDVQFETFLNQNWRCSTASEILAAFKNVKRFCIDKQIPISSPHFDNLVDGLMDHCEKLTDDQILELLYCLIDYPHCDSFDAHNFHDVWSCLDDICCWKMNAWNIDKVLNFADAWFKWNLSRFSDFIWEVLDRHVKKADTLTKDQMVKIFFLFNASRRRKVDFEYEHALQTKILEMNVNEMAVVALGYFKTETKIQNGTILEIMIDSVSKNSKSIQEITLTAILKILRLSKPIKLSQKITEMLNKLTPEVDRISDLACLHLALVPTGLLLLHEKSLKKCAEKLSKNIEDIEKIRIKEIERLLNALTMFNFDPKIKPDIFKVAHQQIHRTERSWEITKHPRSLVSSLNYLSIKNMYSYELMDHVLDMEFVRRNFGKVAYKVPREIFSLDCCIDVECPDYKGKRLPLDIRYKATKWHCDFTPTYDQYKKITAAERLVLDTIDTIKRIVKNDNLLYINHVLPHYPRADIILCKNKKTNKFIEPIGFQRYIFGDIMLPLLDKNLIWYAIMTLGWNNTIRDTSVPLGHMVMKERQLKRIGYKPVMVIWNQFSELSTKEKESYILEKLN